MCCGVDVRTYTSFQNLGVFNWDCPKCIADQMPFHDCSVLSSSSVDMSGSVYQCDSIVLPSMTFCAALRIAHLNCHSLLSVADEVFDLFTRHKIDVFAIGETWLDSSITDNETFPYS